MMFYEKIELHIKWTFIFYKTWHITTPDLISSDLLLLSITMSAVCPISIDLLPTDKTEQLLRLLPSFSSIWNDTKTFFLLFVIGERWTDMWPKKNEKEFTSFWCDFALEMSQMFVKKEKGHGTLRRFSKIFNNLLGSMKNDSNQTDSIGSHSYAKKKRIKRKTEKTYLKISRFQVYLNSKRTMKSILLSHVWKLIFAKEEMKMSVEGTNCARSIHNTTTPWTLISCGQKEKKVVSSRFSSLKSFK